MKRCSSQNDMKDRQNIDDFQFHQDIINFVNSSRTTSEQEELEWHFEMVQNLPDPNFHLPESVVSASDVTQAHTAQTESNLSSKSDEHHQKIHHELNLLRSCMKRKSNSMSSVKMLPASKYCHLDGRNGSHVVLMPCKNYRSGHCRKSICTHCIEKYRIPVINGNELLCTHCSNTCPSGARCHSYNASNKKRFLVAQEHEK
mmetsp:Transcript_197/g.334  ORF Transcript_197/g.334 Transcript_197/m.334 type:complete len:201 (-) Transcript_197:237-839(-)